jgi:hypothetical protein
MIKLQITPRQVDIQVSHDQNSRIQAQPSKINSRRKAIPKIIHQLPRKETKKDTTFELRKHHKLI